MSRGDFRLRSLLTAVLFIRERSRSVDNAERIISSWQYRFVGTEFKYSCNLRFDRRVTRPPGSSSLAIQNVQATPSRKHRLCEFLGPVTPRAIVLSRASAILNGRPAV